VGSKVLDAPPVLPGRVGSNALVFVEDRRNMGSWNFGGDYLFQYVYLDTTLRQKEVPSMASVSPELCAEWLRHPNPFFLQHDDDFNWRDGSLAFRKHALEVLPQYTSVLLGNQKWSDAVSLIGPLLPEAERTPAGYLLLYHHAYSLHQMGKLQQAVDAYGRSIALNRSYSLPVLQRGYALAAIGKTVDACADFRKSAQLEPRQPVHEDTMKKYCR
jgi:tetratricopeptide (TPR) repeat protein